MMRKKRMILAAALFAAAMMAAACGKKGDAKSSTAAAESASGSESGSESSSAAQVSEDDPELKKLEETKVPKAPAVSKMGKIKLPDLSTIEVTVSPREDIKDDEVEDQIRYILEGNKTKVDAPAEKGDSVNIDYEGKIDGQAFDGGSAQGYELELGSNSFIPGFEDQLIGHKSGEDVTVKVTFPQDYRNKDVAGKDAEFSVKINSVEKTPELTDEWVKNYQETTAETVDAFRTQMKERMVAGSDYNYHMEIQQKALADIVDKSEITLSDSMKKYATAYAIRSQLVRSRSTA